MEPIHLHPDCVGCLAAGEDASRAVLALLRMFLVGDADAESVKGDLCFEHRRILNLTAQSRPSRSPL